MTASLYIEANDEKAMELAELASRLGLAGGRWGFFPSKNQL
jgi:hypothetical protein